MQSINNGTLYVVATPIGNLDDLSPRALNTLRSVNLILAEDTRHFGTLKTKFSITTPVKSYHDHSEQKDAPHYIKRLLSGENIALVSDAGTPAISDPGYRIIRAARENEIAVVPIPGPCAGIAAVSVCGFEINRFLFEGFLPQKPGKKQKRLSEILASQTTTVIYESPFRILKTIAAIAELEPQRELFVAREITKIHEESLYGTAKKLKELLEQRAAIKGEFVLVIRGSAEIEDSAAE